MFDSFLKARQRTKINLLWFVLKLFFFYDGSREISSNVFLRKQIGMLLVTVT